jgi:hypothetical protein
MILTRFYGMRRYLLGAIIAVLGVILLGGVYFQPDGRVSAVVDSISVSGVSTDCKQVTIELVDSGNSGTRTGYIEFLGSVSIPQIDVSCAAGNCDSVNDSYTLDINGGSGYSSASPVNVTFRAHKTSFAGIFNTGAGFPLYSDVSGTDPLNEGSIQLPACSVAPPPTTPDPGGSPSTPVPGPSGPVTQLPVLDSPGTAPRVYGGVDNLGSELVIYREAYGYDFYSYTGVFIGSLDLGSVGIPGPGGLITSFSSGGFRVDVFYHRGDNLFVRMYSDGLVVEEGAFTVSGISARAGEVAGGGGTSSSFQGGTDAGTALILCSLRLREDASTATAVLDVLAPGTTVSIVGRSGDNSWLRVGTPDGLTGWAFNGRCMNVNSPNVNNAPIEVQFDGQPIVGDPDVIAPPPIGVGPIQANAAPGVPVIGITCNQNLRAGPSNDSPVVRVLPRGSTLAVVGRTGEMAWVQVSASNVNGWTALTGCATPVSGDISSAPITAVLGQ